MKTIKKKARGHGEVTALLCSRSRSGENGDRTGRPIEDLFRLWGAGSRSKKPVEAGFTAIAKMAYGVMVWVLILMCMILQHDGHDPGSGHALALGFQY